MSIYIPNMVNIVLTVNCRYVMLSATITLHHLWYKQHSVIFSRQHDFPTHRPHHRRK